MNALAGKFITGSLTHCWVQVIRELAASGVSGIAPLVVQINELSSDGVPREDHQVRELVNRVIEKRFNGQGVETVSNTIFPNSLWQPGVARNALFERYRRMLPKLRSHSGNQLGIYFERMIAFDDKAPFEGNQLEFIVNSYGKGLRRTSAFQIVLTDPRRDMVGTPRRGFPCLQQVAVNPNAAEGTLGLLGFYPTQYLFERGYGNYLGLARLGRFLAYEMGLRLNTVACVTARAVLGVPKADVTPLLQELDQLGLRDEPVEVVKEVSASTKRGTRRVTTRRRGDRVVR